MKKILKVTFFLIAMFAFIVPVFATYVLTNEVKMFGYGSSTKTIGGEQFPASYRVMIDKTNQVNGNVTVDAVIKEKVSWFTTNVFGHTWIFPNGSAGGRWTYNVSGRPKKPTTMYWMKADYTKSSAYVIGSYQY